jgi:Zn-dependent M28 family amino/carboxypeptidase
MTRTILLTVTVIAAAAQVAGPAAPQFSADRFKAHVTFLADDLLEGREAGTRGHEIAARYIASQFALMGIKPGAADGSYFESVPLLEVALAGPKATIVATGSSGTHTLTQGESAVIRGPVGGGEVKLKAPLVFVGYGMKDAALGYDDYDGLDVQGKIAVELFGYPKGMDSEIGAHLLSQQTRMAADQGAAAVLLVETRATGNAFRWEKLVETSNRPGTTWVQKDGTPFDPGHGVRASAYIDPKAAVALFEGAPRSLDQVLDEAEETGGRPKGFALKGSAEIAVSTKVRQFSSPEVIGTIEGSDPRIKDEYVALMAHADHIGIKPEGSGDRINNGALDNGAGVATLLEVARAFATASERPHRSILVVANTAEEKGLLGADYFAHYPPVPIERITAAIDLDMPMLLYDFTDVVAFGATHSSLEGVFAKATRTMNVKLSPDPMPEQAVFVRSDHYPMVKMGVPAVALATGMANGGAAAWGTFLANNYHQPSDDLSQPILWTAGAKFAELNYRVVRALADSDTRARWYAHDYFGDRFAPKASKADKPASR